MTSPGALQRRALTESVMEVVVRAIPSKELPPPKRVPA